MREKRKLPDNEERRCHLTAMTTHGFKNSKQEFNFGPWKLTANKSHIMKSKDIEKLAEEMNIHSLPEMLFGDNVLKVQHAGGFGIVFNATDALRRVDNGHGTVKVACADAWQESRADSEHSKEIAKSYDWTFTTDYKGTLMGEKVKLKVTPTTDRIDLEKLKAREQIMYFEEVLLFEDELHDHGVSMLSVKVRVMPSSFFLLLRFFLRVDGVLIRTNDTRIYHEADKNYLLSEYTSRESKMSSLENIPPSLYTDPNEISQYLSLKYLLCEKLEFPPGVDNTSVCADLQNSATIDSTNTSQAKT